MSEEPESEELRRFGELWDECETRMAGLCLQGTCTRPVQWIAVTVNSAGRRVVWCVCKRHRQAVADWYSEPVGNFGWVEADRAPALAGLLIQDMILLGEAFAFPRSDDWQMLDVCRPGYGRKAG